MNGTAQKPISLGGRSNNFDALRFLFAAMVILNHSHFMVDKKETNDPLYWLLGGQVDSGSLGVNAFFAISGFLITLSWVRSPKLPSYLWKRVLRIFPGFLACFFVCVLIVAPFAGAKWEDILQPKGLVTHVVRALLLSPPRVAGAFENSVTIPDLNSSLWTIRYEFFCYLLVPLVLFLARGKSRAAVVGVFAISLALHVLDGKYRLWPKDGGISLSILGHTRDWPRFLSYFAAGMVMAQFKDVIPIRRSFAAIALAILIVTGFLTGGFYIAMATAGVYLLFYVAFEPAIPLANFGKRGDFSYGLYLYGWPIQQLILYYYPASTGWTIFWCALPLTFVAAVFSWHLVEGPCLRRKTHSSIPPAGEKGHLEATVAQAPTVRDAEPHSADAIDVKQTPGGGHFTGEPTR